ncbi:hypothetical protein DFH11DRAFT_902225 [Phellopilus nigrolimitatus]|nr:hypothetical protein DFH11DRAFT_902225 [Phellopilus nigrolimitatus]
MLTMGLEKCCGMARLPPEILQYIFSMLEWNVRSNPLLPTGAVRPWFEYVRSFKSITLVCRIWWTLAAPTLYSITCLRRVGQLSALVRTLQEDRLAPPRLKRHFDYWIKHLYIRFFVPVHWQKICRSDLVRLLALCSGSVEKLVYDPIVYDPLRVELSLFHVIDSHTFQYPIPDSHLQLIDDTTPAKVSNICSHIIFPVLKELHLDLSLHISPYTRRRGEYEKAILPCLEVLVCNMSMSSTSERTKNLITSWVLPKLWHIAIAPSSMSSNPLNTKHLAGQSEELCVTYRATLKSVSLNHGHSYAPNTGSSKTLQSLFTQFPRLESFACSEGLFSALLETLVEALSSGKSHVNAVLRRIELLSMPREPEVVSNAIHVFRHAFPALDAITLHHALFSVVPVPLYAIEDSDSAVGEFLSDWVAVAKDEGVRLLNWEGREISIADDMEEDSDSEEDPAYEPVSDPEDGYSEGPGSESEDEWNGFRIEDERSPTVFESSVSRTEVLRIFEATLDTVDYQMFSSDSDESMSEMSV